MYRPIGRFVYDGAAVSVAQGGNVLFSSNTIQTNAIAYDGAGGIQLKAPGTYMVHANFTTTATAADNQEVQMYAGSNAVAGAHAIGTAAAVGNEVPLAFNAVETVKVGNSGYATLTFKSAGATSIAVACVVVEKVA